MTTRIQVYKEICKDFQHKSSPAEFSTSQYLLNSAPLIVPIIVSTSLQIQHLGMWLHFSILQQVMYLTQHAEKTTRSA